MQPTAELSCSPDVADVNETPIAVSWLCRDSSTSKGEGFNTNGETSGSAEVTLKSKDLKTDADRVDLILTCSKGTNKTEDSCPITINRPLIIAIANPNKVARGETATLGWITKGMSDNGDVCKATSDQHPDFSETGRDTVVTTPPIEEKTNFTIHCDTLGGSTLEAVVTIDVL